MYERKAGEAKARGGEGQLRRSTSLVARVDTDTREEGANGDSGVPAVIGSGGEDGAEAGKGLGSALAFERVVVEGDCIMANGSKRECLLRAGDLKKRAERGERRMWLEFEEDAVVGEASERGGVEARTETSGYNGVQGERI